MSGQPLPKPAHYLKWERLDVFTAEQMQAFRAEGEAVGRRLAAAEFEKIRNAGDLLANCAFNLAQRSPGEFTARDAKSLDEARKRWDEAIR